MQTQTETKEKGICDIFGCENEATVFGQTLRFCYEHYCKITHNAASIIESETETFFDRRKRKVTAKRVAVPMDADLLAEAKKWNVNIEEATRKHFEKVKDDYLLDMICGTSEVRIEGELLKRFEVVKKDLGLEDDTEVIRVLLNEKYEQLFPKKA